MDTGHFVLFAALAVSAIAGLGTTRRARFAIAIGLILFAAGVEVVQPLFDRSESAVDLENGVLGVLFGVVAASLMQAKAGLKGWGSFGAASVLTFGILCFPAYREWQAIEWRRTQLPLLGNFENEVELKLWRPPEKGSSAGTTLSISKDMHTDGSSALRIERREAKTIGLAYYAGDMDWSAFTALTLDIFSAVEGELRFRIDDSKDCSEFTSRFNRAVSLQSGWNTISFPAAEIRRGPSTRELQLSSIRRMLIFTTSPTLSELYIDNVRLR